MRFYLDYSFNYHKKKVCILIIILHIVSVLHPSELFAREWKKTYKTESATIYYGRTRDLDRFTKNIGDSFFSLGENQKKDSMLAKERVDKIVDRVRRLLDMYPPDLHINIYIYPNFYELEAKYRGLGMMKKTPVAFYFHRERAIYVSAKDITDSILAHEIAHAVINSFFAAPPPERTQEVLAQYVHMHLWAR